MKRIAVVDNSKFKDMEQKQYALRMCNRAGVECAYLEGDQLRINEGLCVGPLAQICVKAAPHAIKIVDLPEILDKDPIHRYGKNGFALFSLPTPIFGKVVGVLGVNGIGKSTAIKILAGELKPNLGLPEQDFSYSRLIDYFKGTETQLFFEKLMQGSIVVAYKPQHVDQIPRKFEGRVIDLLGKVDEKNMLSDVAEKLSISHILESDIRNISGGELQRVAIAAAMLRKANLYIFDEPTSYLDIKQRLIVSGIIRELAAEGAAVIVAEHDLIALDYMTDMINIFYGEPGGYGIVSSVMATNNGINTFLDGYLPEENIRFRDYRIRFEVRPPAKARGTKVLSDWPSFRKRLGRFTLLANPGTIYYGEKIGVLGENGIGKTTFARILSGIEKPDDKALPEKVTVSYKPQFIESASEDLVAAVLEQAIRKHDALLVRPLNLQPLFMRRISELSGGELQKVAIAACLSRDADMFLLDEPSAYLDVEERLRVSKMIASFVEEKRTSCLVIDHDLLFLDYLSDRLIVFTGEPGLSGQESGPFSMEDGMNMLLQSLGITLRREPASKRPRINKAGSVKDREQKRSGRFYYST